MTPKQQAIPVDHGAPTEKRASRGARLGRLAVLSVPVLLLAAGVALSRPLPVSGPAPDDGFARARGVIHVHTTFSDGGGTVEEVVERARGVGLDFVVLSDHNNLDAKPQEGYHDSLLLLVGTEVSTTSGYVLGLGIPDPAFRFSGDARDAFDDIRQLGGVAFAAHPTSSRPEFAWRGWDLAGDWGLEVVNLDCQWRDASWWRLLRTALLYPLNPRHSLLGLLSRPTSVLQKWDERLARRHVPAITAADAHSRIRLARKMAVRLPSYDSLFSITLQHVLLDTPLSGAADRDGAAIIEALAKGRSYLGIDGLAPADGFFFEAISEGETIPESGRWTMGDTVPSETPSRLRAGGRLPEGARLVLRRDGRILLENETALECPTPGPGVYRVEVYVPGWSMPWVLSNPIYVFGKAEAEARRRRALPPAETVLPPMARLLDDFEEGTVFRPEADSSSTLDPNVLDSSAPWQGQFSGKMRFRLGDGNAGRQSASCALVSRERRDWSGASGLVFAIRGDGDYRVHVQIRDENSAGRDNGTETWFASAKASETWRRVAIPFSFFRSTDPRTDGRLDLDRIRLVAFVVDKGADKIGTEGAVWFDEFGLY